MRTNETSCEPPASHPGHCRSPARRTPGIPNDPLAGIPPTGRMRVVSDDRGSPDTGHYDVASVPLVRLAWKFWGMVQPLGAAVTVPSSSGNSVQPSGTGVYTPKVWQPAHVNTL